MKNLEIELEVSFMGRVLVTHEALGLIPRMSRKKENLEIELGMVIHSCNVSNCEAEAPDLCEFKASLVYTARPRLALNYTVRPCLKKPHPHQECRN
jgi:hypothetical protein